MCVNNLRLFDFVFEIETESNGIIQFPYSFKSNQTVFFDFGEILIWFVFAILMTTPNVKLLICWSDLRQFFRGFWCAKGL